MREERAKSVRSNWAWMRFAMTIIALVVLLGLTIAAILVEKRSLVEHTIVEENYNGGRDWSQPATGRLRSKKVQFKIESGFVGFEMWEHFESDQYVTAFALPRNYVGGWYQEYDNYTPDTRWRWWRLRTWLVVIPLWFAFLSMHAFRAWGNRSRIAAGCCKNCGYDLRQNVSGRCPECGVPTVSVS